MAFGTGIPKSFAPVSDLIEIETYQCYVPDTLPSFKWNENKKRTLTEKSILYTYYELMTRIADGEKFIIMEHDAYLNPDRIDIFRKWLELRYRMIIPCGHQSARPPGRPPLRPSARRPARPGAQGPGGWAPQHTFRVVVWISRHSSRKAQRCGIGNTSVTNPMR